MATLHITKIQIDAPPPEDLLPRWRYAVTLKDNDSDATRVVSFLSDDENPMNNLDTCNTVNDLLGDDNLDFVCEDAF